MDITEDKLKLINEYIDQQIEFLTGDETKEDIMGFIGETASVIQGLYLDLIYPIGQIMNMVKERLPKKLLERYDD